MPDIEELIRQLVQGTWEQRRDAARALATVPAPHRDEAVRSLKDRLREETDNDVTEAIIGALERLVPDAEVVAALKDALRVNRTPWAIRAIIEALRRKGVTIGEMSRILLSNPGLRAWAAETWADLLDSDEAGVVIERVLRRHWWRLPGEVRRQFDFPWPWYGHRHRWPELHMLWHRLERLLEGRGRGRDEAEWLIASMGRWWGSPRWRFARHDFEALMSLRVERPVTYEEQNVLRFRYLDAFASDPQGRPLRDWIGQFQRNWDELLGIEEQFDRVRDEISDLHRQQEEILQEAERRTQGEWHWEGGEPPRLPQDLQGRWREIAERLRRLEGDEEPGELQRLRRRLEEATEGLMPSLREVGVRFPFIEVEGVLGEYNFYERKVTLYPPMIELGAGELADALQRPSREVFDDLYTITEMHETAHAVAHLGLDSNDRSWQNPADGTPALHETIAQFYTFSLLERLGDRPLLDVFLKLNDRQPEHYTFWRYLRGIPLERVRTFLRYQREGHWRDDILTYAAQVADVLRRSAELLKGLLPPEGWQAFDQGLRAIKERFARAGTLKDLCEAADALIAHCEACPPVWTIIRATVGRHLPPLPGRVPSPPGPRRPPTRWERGLLMVAALCQDGRRVTGPTLRLSVEELQRRPEVSLTASALRPRDVVLEGLTMLEELKAPAGPPPEDEVRRHLERLVPLLEELLRVLKGGGA